MSLYVLNTIIHYTICISYVAISQDNLIGALEFACLKKIVLYYVCSNDFLLLIVSKTYCCK